MKIQIGRKVLQQGPKQCLPRQTQYKTNHFIRDKPTKLITITRISTNIITHMLLLLTLLSRKRELDLFVQSQDILLLSAGIEL